MSRIIERRNRKFQVIKENLKPEALKTDVLNGLYAAIYLEFRGAAVNPKYSKLSTRSRIDKVNEFAINWLKERGLY